MTTLSIALAAAFGYLVGSISMGRLVWKIAAPRRPIPKQTAFRLEGSDSQLVTDLTSATTISHHLGPRYGFLTYVLDVLKVALSALVVKQALPGTPYYLITAAAGVIGHAWPVYYGFRGGRGISAIYGGVFIIDWLGVFATSLAGMGLGLLLARDMMVAYMAGVWLLIPWLWFRTHDVPVLIYAVIINLAFNIAMIPEIKTWVRITREGQWSKTANVMQLTGMGRGILKMARKLKIYKGA